MTNHKGVETCIQKFGNNDEEYYKRNPNETRQKGVEEVMSLMTRVGAMITEVSNNENKKGSLIVKSVTRFYLIVN